MSRVIGIGACVCDTLITVPYYPKEDTKLRADFSKISGGGPVSTGLVAVSKLGESAEFIGVLSDDSAGDFLRKDFAKYGVVTDNCITKGGYRSFTSTIWLSNAEKSRTCVFDKGDLPPFELNVLHEQEIKNAEILMVDGNEMSAAIKGAEIAKENGVKVLYDAGGLYDGVEKLLPYADYLIPSMEFALGYTGENTVEAAAKKLYDMYTPQVVVITCGKDGGYHFDGKEGTYYPVYPVNVLDSNGSGDVFHGAFAAGLCKGYDTLKCCHFASAVSAIKCTGIGARESVPDFETVKKFLKENGYEL